MQRQESCRGQVWLSESQVGETSVVNVENACASGATALHQAWLSVAAGVSDVAVAVGVEKMYDRDGNRQVLEAMTAVVDQDGLERIAAEHTTASLFMGIYARWAREYAQRSGATPEDFARVAVKNHDNGARNPKAQYRSTYTLDEVLQARLIAEPLTLPMCAPVSDGAAALVVTTPERAARWGAAPVRMLGIAVGGGRIGSHGTLIPRTAARAYALADVTPEQVDVAECHDAAAPAELIVMEELGLCAPGEAPDLVRAGETEIGGALPINPSGGLESKGHPLGATGCGQVVELCDQLRDRCGDRQVAGATIALAENTGGYLGPDAAAAVVTLLARA
jgi:acetyl-CoA acetyltransferase